MLNCLCLKSFIENNNYVNIWVAYSGGLDSTVLLHLMAEYKHMHAKNISFKAIHINHNLSPNASQWESHAANICANLKIPLIIRQAKSKPAKGESIESWARKQRYKFFSELNPNQSKCGIILAHHQNDQAETFLLNALKGSGPVGLSAMPKKRVLNNIDIIRPLLNLSQNDLTEYAIRHKLNWTEDESNLDDKFDRNYLRKQIIKPLQLRWPKITASLSRSANLCAEHNTVLMEYIDRDLEKLAITPNQPDIINYADLTQYDFSKRKIIIKRWVEKLYTQSVTFKSLEQFCEQLLSAPSGWQYKLNHDLVVRRYRQDLSIHKESQATEQNFCYFWEKHTQYIHIAELNENITADALINFGIDTTILSSGSLSLRSRQPQDNCKPIGRYKKNKLKIIFQEKGITPWERKLAIILSIKKNNHEKIIAVWPFFICD